MTSTEKTTHTPGPWTVDDGHDIYADNVHIAKLRFVGPAVEHETDPDRDFPETEANARLIAAAPALLEAAVAFDCWDTDLCGFCRTHKEDCDFITGHGDNLDRPCVGALLRRAIAAAKGERS